MVAQIALGIYSLMILVGGIIGYKKAGSQKSLIGGIVSGVVAAIALGLTFWDVQIGLGVGLVTAILLTVVFVGRWRATGKWMPAGLMVALSVVMIALLGSTLALA